MIQFVAAGLCKTSRHAPLGTYGLSKRLGQPSSHTLAHPTNSSTSNKNTAKIVVLCWESLVLEILFQL